MWYSSDDLLVGSPQQRWWFSKTKILELPTHLAENSTVNISLSLLSLAVQSLHPSNCLFIFNQCWLEALMNLPSFCFSNLMICYFWSLVFCFSLEQMFEFATNATRPRKTPNCKFFLLPCWESWEPLSYNFLSPIIPFPPSILPAFYLSSLKMPQLFLISSLTFMSTLIYM